MHRSLFFVGALFGFLSVAIGAFAAHILKSQLPPDLFDIFEVAVRYQFYHALAILIAAMAWSHFGSPSRTAGWLFACGIVIFSGSLYALSLSGVRTFGAVTPIGGVLFLAGWGMLCYGALRK